jgi:CheY-like chemotaxis protein
MHPQPPPRRKTCILSIEDNADFAHIMEHLLKVMNCETHAANDAETGFEMARREDYDMIFCDIGLGGAMDGLAFARAIRASDALKHLPLVAVTARATPKDHEKALAAGFDRVFAKPVKFADLSKVLKDLRHGAGPGIHPL